MLLVLVLVRPASAQTLFARQPIGRGRLRGRRRILLAQRELMLQILDPLRLLGHLPIPLGQFAPQSLNLLLQPRFGARAIGPLCSRHAPHGTPIASTCTDPLNCYEPRLVHFDFENRTCVHAR